MLWRSGASHRPRITERRFCIHSGDTRGSFTLDLKEAERRLQPHTEGAEAGGGAEG